MLRSSPAHHKMPCARRYRCLAFLPAGVRRRWLPGGSREFSALTGVPGERKTLVGMDAHKVHAEPGGRGSPSATFRSWMSCVLPDLAFGRSSLADHGRWSAELTWGGSARQDDRGASCTSINLSARPLAHRIVRLPTLLRLIPNRIEPALQRHRGVRGHWRAASRWPEHPAAPAGAPESGRPAGDSQRRRSSLAGMPEVLLRKPNVPYHRVLAGAAGRR
jgi:hypothetical protein